MSSTFFHRLTPVAATIATFAVLAGCTTALTSAKVDNFSNSTKGQIYYLPRAEYQVSVSRELRSCTVAYASNADAALSWLTEQLGNLRYEESPALQVAFIRSIEADPAIQQGDVKQPLDELLGKNWSSKLVVPTPVTLGSKKPRGTPGQNLAVDDDLLRAFESVLHASKPSIQLKLEATLTAQATPAWAPDTAYTYSLDYDLMQSGLKGTDYSVEQYPNGTLKSVNVTIDDQTGPAIQSVLGGVAKFAAAAGGFPLSLGTKPQAAGSKPFQSFSAWKDANSSVVSPCKSDIKLKLYQRAGLEAQADANAEDALAQQKKVDKLDAAQVKAIAELEKAKAALKEIDSGDPKRHEAEALVKKTTGDAKLAAKAVLDAKSELDDLAQAGDKVATRLAALRKGLTVVHTTTFRPTFESRSLHVAGELEAISAWTNEATLKSCAEKTDMCDGVKNFETAISAYVAIHTPPLPKIAANAMADVGVYYRQPLRGVLVVCKKAQCTNDAGLLTAGPDSILLNTPADVPQLGALAVLPLKNVPFQNNTISASFAESGALTKVTYKSNAAAAKAAEVFEASADTVLKFKDAKRKQESTKLDSSAAELDSQKKLVEAQLALEKAQADLDAFRSSQKKSVQ